MDLSFRNIARNFNISLLARYGYTRKKMKWIALQNYRGAFMAEVCQYSRDMFIWVDETAGDMLRRYGEDVKYGSREW